MLYVIIPTDEIETQERLSYLSTIPAPVNSKKGLKHREGQTQKRTKTITTLDLEISSYNL